MRKILVIIIVNSVVIISNNTAYPQQLNRESTPQIINEDWVRFHSFKGSINNAKALALDEFGNVYITGSRSSLKYDSDGNILFVKNLKGNDIVMDTQNNFYVAGYVHSSATNRDFAITKYNLNGSLIWQKIYNGNSNNFDNPQFIVLDDNENIYVSGVTVDSAYGWDLVTIKYTSDGTMKWAYSHNSPGNDMLLSMDVIKSEKIIMNGKFPSFGDCMLLAIDSTGAKEWDYTYNCHTSLLATDEVGNIYTSTGVLDPWTPIDTLHIFTLNGELERSISSPFFEGRDLLVDSDGNVTFTGVSSPMPGAGGLRNIVTIKYDTSGNKLWARGHSDVNTLTSHGSKVITDDSNNIYVIGEEISLENWPRTSVHTLKYDSDGKLIWNAKYGSDSGCDLTVGDIAVDEESVYVLLTCVRNDSSQYVTIKYSPKQVGVLEESHPIFTNFILSQNYPNPFNPVTTVEYSLPKSGDVTLIVYNIVGQEVARLIDSVQQAGNHNIKWDASNVASGMYIYRLQAGDFVQTRKMVLLK